MNGEHDELAQEIASALDYLEPVAEQTLFDLVTRDGACMTVDAGHDEPTWANQNITDRELAARTCAGCPVQFECLELEFRVTGPSTLGVWGALDEDDRQATYQAWLARRDGGRQ